MRFKARLHWLALFFILGTASLAFGQGIVTGSITGVVVDSQGAVIQKAQVSATNIATGVVLKTVSQADGTFAFHALLIGTYRVSITAQGFNTVTENNVDVAAGVTANLNQVALQAGATTQTVQVNASQVALLNPTESQATTTFSTQQVEDLPLNNGFDTITEVIPGVVSTHAANFSNTNGDGFSVNGQSGRNNNFELDGQTNNDNSIGGPQIFFGNQDAIAQIQVITNDFSAQYGRNAGAVVNYITKSGTNHFHGSAFEMYQGQALSSMTNGDKSPLFGYCASGQSASSGCAAPVMPRYVENRFGATFGGPILKNKLFGFGSTYWDRVRSGVSPSQSLPDLTPTPAGIADLAADYPNSPAVAALKAVGPYSITAGDPQPIPGTQTMESITGPDGKPHSIPFAGVTRSIPSLFNDEEDMGRLDWQPDSNDHFFVRYFYQSQLSTGIASGSVAAGQYVDVPAISHSISGNWSHVFSPKFVNQLRYAFQESKVHFQGGAHPNCVTTAFASCSPEVDFIGNNSDQGFGDVAGFPQGRTVKVTQVQDNATATLGNQTLLFGGEFDYQNSPNVFLPLYNGLLLYGTFSNFMQDSGLLDIADGNPVIPFTEPDLAFYFQDDWHLTPSFTAHLGLRWEYFGQAVNLLHNETVTRESNPSTAFWDSTLPLADRTVPKVNQDYHNFEPRLGLAWNPGFDKQLVVSAGYAINANPAFYNIFLIDAIASPVSNSGIVGCNGNCLPTSGTFTGASLRAQDLTMLPRGGNPEFRDQTYVPTNFRTPYVQTYTLAVKHQIGKAAVFMVRYTGVKTTDNFQSVDANPYLAPVASAFPTYNVGSLCSDPNAAGYGRPDCNKSNLALVTNGGWADYNGLDVNLTTRRLHGLTSTISYTYSREIDNVTDVFSTLGGGSTVAFAQNPQNTDIGERGVDGNSYPNVVGLTVNYQLPKFVHHDGLLSRIVNGFSLNSLYRYDSGQPYNPYQPLTLDSITGDTSFCDAAFNSSSVGPAQDTCRLALSNPKAPLNTVAYLNPYTGPMVNGSPTLGNPVYVEYNSDSMSTDANGNPIYNPGTPMDPSSAHWIINNQAYAQSVNNPYPGSGRNILRGDSFSDLDASIFKTIPITHGINLQLQFDGYNVLNQMYRGAGNADVGNYSPTGFNSFLSTAENVDATVPGDASGQRFFIYGGKITF